MIYKVHWRIRVGRQAPSLAALDDLERGAPKCSITHVVLHPTDTKRTTRLIVGRT